MIRLLLICNFAAHYRSAVYQKIDSVFQSDFVIGDKAGDIKPMDYGLLKGNVDIVHNVFFKHGSFQKGVLKYPFKDYDTYLITGEFRCLSTWLLLVILRLFPRKKAFIWTHGWLGKESWSKRMLTSIFFKLSNGIFVYNNRSRGLMINGGVSAQKVVTIYNSLDYDKQLAIRRSLRSSDIYRRHFGNENKVLIFIGRLTAVKKLRWLIDALEVLCQREEYFNLVIVGDGIERQALEKKVSEKGLSQVVWFCGACYDEKENADYLYNADLCVSPGNVGLTAIHAMMYGCPVITNDDFDHQMPEFEAIQKGRTGDFFTQGSVHSLAETISSWFLKQFYDRDIIRHDCFREIDTRWMPVNQIEILKSVML